MADTNDLYDKHFTVEQANAMLPLVRAIVGDLSHLYLDLVERQQRLEYLSGGRDKNAADVYSDELAEIESNLEIDRQQLREYVEELQQLGIECKDPASGLIDFPTKMDGREVYLCWKLEEPEVLHWHDLDAGFAGRQPLTAGAGIGDVGTEDSFEL